MNTSEPTKWDRCPGCKDTVWRSGDGTNEYNDRLWHERCFTIYRQAADSLYHDSMAKYFPPFRVWAIFSCERSCDVDDGQGKIKTFLGLVTACSTARSLSHRIPAVIVLDANNKIVTEYRGGRELTRAEIFTPRD